MEGETENKKRKSLTQKLVGVGQKAIIYGGNYLPSVISQGSNLGHPDAIVGNLALDVISWCSPEFRGSTAYRLSKLASAVYFFGMSLYDLASMAHGEPEKGINLAFDAPMFYQMIYDMGTACKSSGKTPADDVKKVKNILEKIISKRNDSINKKIDVKKD